ncbi:unnamed protein product [Owenia fusiformis]|uniref:Uncharacterized protein n=1 Tax=Owenia fusiformis TaxID=6347 RepID=A0A8J1XX53_OWEFU|nr:unnamed protein product [Owenia fusiformis]
MEEVTNTEDGSPNADTNTEGNDEMNSANSGEHTTDNVTLLPETRIRVPKRKIIVEPVLILYACGAMAILGTISQYWYQRFAEDNHFVYNPKTGSTHCDVTNASDPDFIKQQNIQAETARWTLYYALVWTTPGFVTTMVYGAYSDRYGRKLGLLTPVISTVLGETVMFPKRTVQMSGVLKDALDTFTKDPLNKGSKWKLLNLLFVFLFFGLVAVGGLSVYGLRVLDAPLCFNASLSGIYTGVGIGLKLVASIFLLKVLQIWFSDYQMIIIAIVSDIGNALLFAFASNVYMVFGATVIGIFGGLVIPLLRSMMSKIVEPHQIGSLFAAIGCVETLCSLMGQSLFKLIYSNTIKIFAGLTFLVMAATSGIALCLIITYGIRMKLKKRQGLSSATIH